MGPRNSGETDGWFRSIVSTKPQASEINTIVKKRRYFFNDSINRDMEVVRDVELTDHIMEEKPVNR